MGWSALKTQADSMHKIMNWQSTQAEYAKDKGSFVFFEMQEKGDYDDKNPMVLDVIEVIEGTGWKRGTLRILGDGTIINRTYVELPDFNQL